MTRINIALNRLLALAALFDAALLAWWLLRRSQRPCARQSWVRRDEAAMMRDGLIARRALWDDEGLITPDDLTEGE